MWRSKPGAVALLWVCGCVVLALSSRAVAANLAVSNSNSSSVSATSNEGGTVTTPITSQGTFTASSGYGDPDSSSANATITDTAIGLTLAQESAVVTISSAPAVSPDVISGTTESGNLDLYFSVGTNTQFALAGTYTTTGDITISQNVQPAVTPVASATFDASLYDVTTATTVFTDDQSGAPGDVLTLTPEMGTLIAGDVYEFQASASIFEPVQIDPTGSGSMAFSMVPGTIVTPPGNGVPLPAATWPGVFGLLLVGSLLRRVRRQAAL